MSSRTGSTSHTLIFFGVEAISLVVIYSQIVLRTKLRIFFWTRSLKKCDLIENIFFCFGIELTYRWHFHIDINLIYDYHFDYFYPENTDSLCTNMNYFRTPSTTGLPPSLSHVHDFPLTWPVVWPRDQAAIILVNSKQHESPHGYIGRGFRWKVWMNWHDKPYFICCNPVSRQSR